MDSASPGGAVPPHVLDMPADSLPIALESGLRSFSSEVGETCLSKSTTHDQPLPGRKSQDDLTRQVLVVR